METLEELIGHYPKLKQCENDIDKAAQIMIECFSDSGTLLACGNGGSAADSDHIVGELAKGFLKKRHAAGDVVKSLSTMFSDGKNIADKLQEGMKALSLHSQSALFTAFLNDVDPAMVYAQMVYVMGIKGDVLFAISTSGNSTNVVNAAKVAKAKGMKVISLTGNSESLLSQISDVTIRVQETETYKVQELHLPVYHYLCARCENDLMPD